MATMVKKCKICGEEYKCCNSHKNIAGVFRWQDVACCVEHGLEYLSAIEKSRSKTPQKQDVESNDDYDTLDLCEDEDDFYDDEDEEIDDIDTEGDE